MESAAHAEELLLPQHNADRADHWADPAAAPARSLELTVVVPTFNEAANVQPLIRKLDAALAGVEWQVIFVDDDSPDDTAGVVKSIAAVDNRVECLHRIGRRG